VVVRSVGCKAPTQVSRWLTRAIHLGCAVVYTSCGPSHGSSSLAPRAVASIAPSNAPASAQAAVAVRVVTAAGLTTMTRTARRDAARAYRVVSGGRHTLSASIQSVIVTGTIYPSYAGVQAVTASSTQNTTTIPSSVNLAFTNVPVGNNEWVVVDVVGYDEANGAGSHVDLGQLAGLVNVSVSATTATIDANSTLRLQVGMSAMLQGILASYDLQNETTLDTHLGTLISGTAPSPATGLFTGPQLSSFLSTLYQAYNRSITVSTTGSSNPALATVVFNYADNGEKSYVYNASQTNVLNTDFAQQGSPQASSGSVSLLVVGNPFSGLLQANVHTPATTPAVTSVDVRAKGISAPTGSLQIQHVYGGGLYVGMKNVSASALNAGAYTSGTQTIPGRPPADSTTVSSPLVATQASMTMQDPQAAAFVSAPYYTISPTTGQSFVLDCDYSNAGDCRYGDSVVTNVASPNVTVVFNTFNPFALATAAFQVCTGLDCFPLVSGSTSVVRAPFYDGANSLSYYGWTPSAGSAVTGVTQPLTGGYAIAYSGGTSGSIQSATTAYFYPQQDLQVLSDAPAGTTWTATVTCSGQALQNSGIQQPAGFADIYMMNVPGPVQCSPINLAFSLPVGSASSGTVTITSLGIPPITRF